MTARLWVTGLGLTTPLGHGVEATWSRLVRGERALGPVALFDASGQRAALAAEVQGVQVPAQPRGAWSRTSAMALEAAREALRMARIEDPSRRVGLVVGGTTGGMFETERLLAALHAEPGRRDCIVEMLSHPLTSTSDLVDLELGPFARVRTLSSACSSGANAVVVGASWLLAGDVDAVVVGGADGLCRLTLTGFNALGALDLDPCRPFHRRRRGTTLGEGAGFLVLERSADARSRGAEPIAELAGWAVGSEAHHITNPAPDGTLVGRLVGRALGHAGLRPAEVDYVNAHGTGTTANDAMEAAALRIGLGDDVQRIPVSSSKAQIGHTLGAAGAIEAAITALVIARRVLVPTAGLDEPDPALALVHVPHVGRAVPRVRAALSNAFGFGGMSTVLAFTEPELPRTVVLRESRAARSPRVVVTGVGLWAPGACLGPAECADLPVQGVRRTVEHDADALLDVGKARRFDRMARLGAIAVERALREAGAPAATAGVLLGSAFGNVDACAAYMHRVFDKGPRAASPAEFPNLVPSSAVGHISIYTGAQGLAFATADLSVSGSSAFAQAVQLVASGEAPCIVAGASEPKSDIVERVLGALFDSSVSADALRAELAAALVVETAENAEARGVRALAHVAQALEWREAFESSAARQVAAPHPRAEVIVPRPSAAIRDFVAQTAWSHTPVVSCAPSFGDSDALAAAALAVAASRVGLGHVDAALVVSAAHGRGFAVVLVPA